MSKVRLLTTEEMKSLLDVYYVPVATEFAKLLGVSASETTYNHHFADYYFQEDEKNGLNPKNIDVTTFNSYNSFIGLRPVISLDIVPNEVIEKGTECDDGMLKIEFGYFPQTIMIDNNLSSNEELIDCPGYHYFEEDNICLAPIFEFKNGVKYIKYFTNKPIYYGAKKLTIEASTPIMVKVESVTWYVNLKQRICICKDVLLPIDIDKIEEYLTKYFLDDLLKLETKTKQNENILKKILEIADKKDSSFPNEFFERVHFENSIKEKIDLPSINQTKEIGFFDQYLAEPTNFACLLGYEKGYFLNETNPQVALSRDNMILQYIYKSERNCGIRPVLPYELISKYVSKSRLTNLGYEIIEFGEYPKNIVSCDLNSKLEKLYQQEKLIKTGNTYITDYVHVDIPNIPFTKREFEEYEYENEKYIRFPADSNCIGKVINDEIVKKDDCFWLKVEPVKWYVDKERNLATSISVLASGIQFENSENKFTIFDFLKKYFAPNLIQCLESKKEEIKTDFISLEENKELEKQKLGLDDNSINKFRSSIKKVSEEEADKLAKELLEHIYRNYETAGFIDLEYISQILKQGANVNYKENFLIECIKINNIEALKLFIKAGADINSSNKNGMTPLMQAVKLNNSEIVKLLILMGANLNKRDNFYATALNYAYSMDNKVIFDILIQNGAYINTYDIDNLTLKNMHNGKIDTSDLFEKDDSNTESINLIKQAEQDLENIMNEFEVKKKVYRK